MYRKLDWEETGAWRPRGARTRDFVNFARGIDSLPSLDPD
jgi:hypothetical protein